MHVPMHVYIHIYSACVHAHKTIMSIVSVLGFQLAVTKINTINDFQVSEIKTKWPLNNVHLSFAHQSITTDVAIEVCHKHINCQ